MESHPNSDNFEQQPSRTDMLELDLDIRLRDIWRELDGVQEWNLELAAAYIRAAYGKGYCDALSEEKPASLCRDHGYKVPTRKIVGIEPRPPESSSF